MPAFEKCFGSTVKRQAVPVLEQTGDRTVNRLRRAATGKIAQEVGQHPGVAQRPMTGVAKQVVPAHDRIQAMTRFRRKQFSRQFHRTETSRPVVFSNSR